MKSTRLLFLVVLGALVTAALVAGRASTAAPPAPAVDQVASNAAVLAESSTVWFCPGLPPALKATAGRVAFSNIGDTPASVMVTDLSDHGDPTHVTFDVAPDSVVTKVRGRLGGPGALTVETFGGRVVVEEGIEAPRAIDSAPCATQAAPHWYFAAGATPRGVQQWLVIDNPYASDAKVDVTLRTSDGVRKPSALQGLDVTRRSRVVLAIQDIAVRESRVAIEVDTEVGTVVAGQTLVYTTDAGTPGVALSIGSPAAGTDWSFAGGAVQPNSVAVVAITNVGNDAAQIDVQATSESSKLVLAPTSLTLAQDDVVWVQLGRCSAASGRVCANIPDGMRFSLEVRSEQDVPVVAQTLSQLSDAPDIVGVTSAPGELVAAKAWAFGRSRVIGERSTTLSFFNPGAAPAVVRVGLVHAGRVDRPNALQNVTVPPGRGVSVVVVGGSKPASYDAALMIDSTGPVFAERSIVAAGEAVSSIGVIVG